MIRIAAASIDGAHYAVWLADGTQRVRDAAWCIVCQRHSHLRADFDALCAEYGIERVGIPAARKTTRPERDAVLF